MTQPNAEVTVPELWAGVDAGKTEHHCVVIDGEGRRLLSRRVTNDETVLLELIGEVAALAADGPVIWAVDPQRRWRGAADRVVGSTTTNT